MNEDEFINDEPEGAEMVCEAIKELAESLRQPPVVNVQPPSVNVSAPNVNVAPPKVENHSPTRWSFKIVRDSVTQRITEIIADGR